MQGRKTFARWVLLCATPCAACTTDGYRPAPIPPAIETVTVYRALPDTLLASCAKPRWNPAEIETDVDLLGLTARLRDALDRCADQVDAIRVLYRKTVP